MSNRIVYYLEWGCRDLFKEVYYFGIRQNEPSKLKKELSIKISESVTGFEVGVGK
jgi:hypothetical protein